MKTKWLNVIALVLVVVAVALVGFKNIKRDKGHPILNVSYDPTRELYNEINQKFIQKYEDESGAWVGVEQSHGGSTHQAKAVVAGLAADVVTLALPPTLKRWWLMDSSTRIGRPDSPIMHNLILPLSFSWSENRIRNTSETGPI